LIEKHQLVIADIEKIAHLPKYLKYWQGKITEQNLPQYTTQIAAKADSLDKMFYLLSDILPEDKQLRATLEQGKSKQSLKEAIDQQEKERNDTSFHKKCLFCTKVYSGNRAELFSHMFEEHHFNIGRPDNLVYVNKLLDHLQHSIDNFLCVYCEKTFKNHAVLKKHMRKKKHFKINSKNTFYDQFYMINYLEPGKDWKELEEENGVGESDEEDWETSNEDEEIESSLCLFCSEVLPTATLCFRHISTLHHFDFFALVNKLELDFYARVKMINYIRRMVKENKCIYCEEKQENQEALLAHMENNKHTVISPDASFWKNPQYLIPTLENDLLLSGLDDEDDEDDEEEQALPDEMKFADADEDDRFGDADE